LSASNEIEFRSCKTLKAKIGVNDEGQIPIRACVFESMFNAGIVESARKSPKKRQHVFSMSESEGEERPVSPLRSLGTAASDGSMGHVFVCYRYATIYQCEG